jgi:hypothetical protein
MKVFLQSIGVNELERLLRKLHQRSGEALHTIVNTPQDAELIVFCGNLTGTVTDWKLLVRRYPDKCAIYSDDDRYLPLLPGVYCAPVCGWSTKTGRVHSYAYVARHAKKGNPFVSPLPPDRNRDLLFSFQGSTTSFVRKRLFNIDFRRPDVLVEDTSQHTNWIETADSLRQQKLYVEVIARSHFALCPRGAGTGSFRLFEVMMMGAAPVLLADSYVLPKGPDWDSFLIRVPERDVKRLPSILEKHRTESAERGSRAEAEWKKWFSTEKEFNEIIVRCQRAVTSCGSTESLYRSCWPAMTLQMQLRGALRKAARGGVLWTLQAAGFRPPFSVRTHHIPDFDPNTSDDI